MTLAAPEGAIPTSARTPSAVIIGADALLAARPATPVQLAHACIAAGYQSVVPASWGDELIAAATLRTVGQHGDAPAIQCSCPIVAHRLLAAGSDLRPFLISLVSPPVALARYLRAALAPSRLHITYVGRCPGAADAAIDARLTPDELLAIFSDRNLVLEEQPRVFDSVIPSDRRRFRSQPGGLPSAEALWSEGGGRSIVEIEGSDLPVDLAQQLLSGKPLLVDLACALGCVCSGATANVEPEEARARVSALEPPRSQSTVIDERIPVDLQLPLPASPRNAFDAVARQQAPTSTGAYTPPPASKASERDAPSVPESSQSEGEGEPPSTPSRTAAAASAGNGVHRRHSPVRGVLRPISGAMPTTREPGGRQLPRTYVARRRVPSRGSRDGAAAVGSPEHHRAAIAAASVAPLDTPAEPSEHEMDGSLAAARRSAMGSAGAELLSSVEGTIKRPRPPEPQSPADATGVRERAVELPVTPLSDTTTGERFSPMVTSGGAYTLRQLFGFALLIGAVVLVSAVLGIVVGRWLAAH